MVVTRKMVAVSHNPLRVTPVTRAAVLKRDGYRCQRCGIYAPEQMTVDHIQPESLGGSREPDNLQALCGRCNRAKGSTWEANPAKEVEVRYRTLHPKQAAFVYSTAKRKIARCGRRGGKTVGVAQLCVDAFLHSRRVLYAAPTSTQLDTFWYEVKRALAQPLRQGIFRKNESEHFIELDGTRTRIRAQTAWNADTLRGDGDDLLILDEWQLMNEEAWDRVGQPMLFDNNGDAVFIYTPPSLASRSVSKARDPRHAAKMFKMAQEDTTGTWKVFHWTSGDNPFISKVAVADAATTMTRLAYQQEVLALDATEAPGALWKQDQLDRDRMPRLLDAAGLVQFPPMRRIVVAIDPATTSNEQSDETGILVAGIAEGTSGLGYVLEDASGRYTPEGWATVALGLLARYKADRIIGEDNNGGEMVEDVLRTRSPNAPIKRIHASRGKAARAEPVAALYEQGRVKHIGQFPLLEEQLCVWEPLSSTRSPDRLDALVWALTELMVGYRDPPRPTVHNLLGQRISSRDNVLGLDLDDPRYIDKDR